MLVSLSDEIEIKSVPASEVWELHSTLAHGRMVEELFPELFDRMEILEGNGKAGTVFLIYFKTDGQFQMTTMKEKYTVVDDEKRVKVVEVIEGWIMEHCCLTSMKTKYEITEKPKQDGEEEDSCILKYGIEYEAKDLTGAMNAMTNFKHVDDISKAISDHLMTNKKKST